MVEVNELDQKNSVGHCLGMVINFSPHVDVNKDQGLGWHPLTDPIGW